MSKNSGHKYGRERNIRERQPIPTPGDLWKTGNEPILPFKFHRVIMFLLFTKPIPHLFVLPYSSCVSNSCRVHPPRNPCALCSEHRAVSARSGCTFDNAAPVSQSHEPTSVNPVVRHRETRYTGCRTKLYGPEVTDRHPGLMQRSKVKSDRRAL